MKRNTRNKRKPNTKKGGDVIQQYIPTKTELYEQEEQHRAEVEEDRLERLMLKRRRLILKKRAMERQYARLEEFEKEMRAVLTQLIREKRNVENNLTMSDATRHEKMSIIHEYYDTWIQEYNILDAEMTAAQINIRRIHHLIHELNAELGIPEE